VVPRLNRVIGVFDTFGLPIFFTRDWHPSNHVSFKAQGGPWPQHCVQGTAGAEFHPNLKVPRRAVIVSKGDNPTIEAYSGFQGTGLELRLKKLGVDELFLGGLATDYCVKESVLDAIRAGLAVSILSDCVMAVDAKSGDGDRALAEMLDAGARLTTSSEAIKRMASTQQFGHHPSLWGQSRSPVVARCVPEFPPDCSI
jgi:nicotinamidase/pyrazinamidase